MTAESINVHIHKLKCLKILLFYLQEKQGEVEVRSWTWPFRHLSTKHLKLLQNGVCGALRVSKKNQKAGLNSCRLQRKGGFRNDDKKSQGIQQIKAISSRENYHALSIYLSQLDLA